MDGMGWSLILVGNHFILWVIIPAHRITGNQGNWTGRIWYIDPHWRPVTGWWLDFIFPWYTIYKDKGIYREIIIHLPLFVKTTGTWIYLNIFAHIIIYWAQELWRTA